MALRTAEQYVASLQDGRTVFYKGERVPDVTKHPVIQVAIEHASIDYRALHILARQMDDRLGTKYLDILPGKRALRP